MSEKVFKSINWNKLEDAIDKATWEKLTEQFWLDTRVPISNDLDDWAKLSEEERWLYNYVLGGLTMLDTLQSEDGMRLISEHSRTQHEMAVLKNIEFMECLTKGHKLLTPSGWKDVSEITKNHLVLQYNEDGTAEFKPVLNVSSHMPKSLYHFYNTKFDLKVSGGHRMIYEQMSQTKKEDGWHLKETTAENYMNESNTYYKRNILHNQSFIGGVDSDLTPIERIIIAFQADGSINKSRVEKDSIKKIDIRFSFTKEDKINRLKELVNEASKTFDVTFKELKSYGGKRNFAINIEKQVLKNMNTDKSFSDYFDINDFTQEKADKFIDELSRWDSHISTKHEDTITYYTSNSKNADFVKAVATLSSWYYTFGVRMDDRKESYKDSHYIRFTKNEASAYYGFQSKIIKEEIEPEMVYGIEVPSSYLIVLTPKGLVVTGNCVHAKSYSSIFSTLCTPKEIEEIFEWTETNPYIQFKAKTIQDIYLNGTPLQKKVASVFLESFLFYSGFFTPLYYVGMGKMTNVAEVIKLINL